MEKKALGKGLEALLPDKDATRSPSSPSQQIQELSIDRILPSRYQPRTEFEEDELSELAESIKQNGIIQPVLVRRKADGFYELIAGERRFRAAKLLGLSSIPAILRHSTDEQAMELALVENLQRKDLNPMEAARAYHRLLTEFGLTQETVAQRVGKDRSSIANTIRLLSLPKEVQELVQSGQVTLGHAKVILSLDNPESQKAFAREILRRQLSVREAEKRVLQFSKPKRRGRRQRPYPDLEERLQRRLGTKVSILKSRQGGKVVLHYFAPEELDRLVETLLQ